MVKAERESIRTWADGDLEDDEIESDANDYYDWDETDSRPESELGNDESMDSAVERSEPVSMSTETGTSEDETPSFDESQLHTISFGALAKAQESLNPPKKRKRPQLENVTRGDNALDELRVGLQKATSALPLTKSPREDKGSGQRPSKHAPAVQSSKRPVSRKRSVFEPSPSLKSRDPRFDAAITSGSGSGSADTRHTALLTMSHRLSHANKNYSFLSQYRESEVVALRQRIKSLVKTPDKQSLEPTSPQNLDNLKSQLSALEARIRISQQKNLESSVLRQHREKEKAALRSGKKSTPYFLKRSDVKRQMNEERFKGMGKRKREKIEKRKRRREEDKERKLMRGTGWIGPTSPGTRIAMSPRDQ